MSKTIGSEGISRRKGTFSAEIGGDVRPCSVLHVQLDRRPPQVSTPLSTKQPSRLCLARAVARMPDERSHQWRSVSSGNPWAW